MHKLVPAAPLVKLYTPHPNLAETAFHGCIPLPAATRALPLPTSR